MAVLGPAPCQCLTPGWTPDRVTGLNLHRLAPFLGETHAGNHDEPLSRGVPVPSGASARFERDETA